MKLTTIQIEAAVYIFEKENGSLKNDYDEKVIIESKLVSGNSAELEKIILDGLNIGYYVEDGDRCLAYWALSKRFNKKLVPAFRKWLKQEVEKNNYNAVYQLLIALENVGEYVFGPDRKGSSASFEWELNIRDAANYLKDFN